MLFPYREEIAESRRENDAEIKERYGLRSLDYLISESNDKLLEYEHRAEAGEKRCASPSRMRGASASTLEAQRALKKEIRLERNVTVEEPRILGVAALVPHAERIEYETEAPVSLASDSGTDRGYDVDHRDEIEAVGMRVATEYEEAHGWQVEDVSEKDHGGFDLRSMRFSEEDGSLEATRYIEVKARAQSGNVRITSNEWKRARQFGEEYWLYIVTQATTEDPKLTRIQNPAARFEEGQDIRATGYKIEEDAWRLQKHEKK